MKRVSRILTFCVAASLVTVTLADERLPLPAAPAIEWAKRLVGEVYAADFAAANTSEKKTALAKKLLDEAKSIDDSNNRFVILSEAVRLAEESGANPQTMTAIDCVAHEFDIDGKSQRIVDAPVKPHKKSVLPLSRKPHLMCAAGVLDDKWFVRSYWLIGTNVGVGWGSWADIAAVVPQGRILCWDGEKSWGYGRIRIESAATGHKADAYHLFCKEKPAPVIDEQPKTNAKGKKRRSAPQGPPAKLVWSQKDSLIVRAMVKVGDALVVAGPPDLGKKDSNILQFKNEPEALARFLGKKGVFLRVVSAKDGGKISECTLDAMPVFDGRSAAGGRIFLSLENGVLECRGR